MFNRLKHGLVVSCQAEGGSPFNSPDGVALMAEAAVKGGAAGIRTEGKEKTAEIIRRINLPVVGLMKSEFEDGYVRITGSYNDFEALLNVNCNFIAVDGTFRKREGLTGPDFISDLKKRYGAIIMADISTVEDGLACAASGADCLSTTLSGYTPETIVNKSDQPDYVLLDTLSSKVDIPVFAEGRVNTPERAARMLELGAWSVVVGTAITRPVNVTKWFVEAMKSVGVVR